MDARFVVAVKMNITLIFLTLQYQLHIFLILWCVIYTFSRKKKSRQVSTESDFSWKSAMGVIHLKIRCALKQRGVMHQLIIDQ